MLPYKNFRAKSEVSGDPKWSINNNYQMLYGQKGTGKSFFALQILPKIFYNWDFEYIDLNRMMLISNGFNDMDATIKYLSTIFLTNQDMNVRKIFILDHIDWVLPQEDANEMVAAGKKIKQNQLLMFFLDLIDSKKYWLFFIGRHYQNIHSELASISRIDNFVQIAPPDFKKRKLAFKEIIKKSYNPRGAFSLSSMSKFSQEANSKIIDKLGKYCGSFLDKISTSLASSTEHFKFPNLIQIGKTFLYKRV